METTEQTELKELVKELSALIMTENPGVRPRDSLFWIKLYKELTEAVSRKMITSEERGDIKSEAMAMFKPKNYRAKQVSTWTMHI